jgi:hypothetical protein
VLTPQSLDVDGNGTYDALTDGVLLVRYLFGTTGPALTAGALRTGATRTLPADVLSYLNGLKPLLDVDKNNKSEAMYDGLLLLRYLFGLRGNGLIGGAIAADATRKTAAEVVDYIQTLMP